MRARAEEVCAPEEARDETTCRRLADVDADTLLPVAAMASVVLTAVARADDDTWRDHSSRNTARARQSALRGCGRRQKRRSTIARDRDCPGGRERGRRACDGTATMAASVLEVASSPLEVATASAAGEASVAATVETSDVRAVVAAELSCVLDSAEELACEVLVLGAAWDHITWAKVVAVFLPSFPCVVAVGASL